MTVFEIASNYKMYDITADTCSPSFNTPSSLRHGRDQIGIKKEEKKLAQGTLAGRSEEALAGQRLELIPGHVILCF